MKLYVVYVYGKFIPRGWLGIFDTFEQADRIKNEYNNSIRRFSVHCTVKKILLNNWNEVEVIKT